jgi:hypothetical protein
MVKKVSEQARGRVGKKRPTQAPEGNAEEQLLRKATLHLIQKHGMFLVATGARQLHIRGLPAWVISVTLRFAAGHEGYVGDLLYDGEEFTFLTEQTVMDERARKIADDPEGLQQWHEHRRSTLHPGEA